MVELNIRKNSNQYSAQFGKYYVYPERKKQLSIHDMAVHMAEHNTPFSVGTIEGILRDFVACTREQCLNGNTVKVDNLAIFSASVTSNALTLQEGSQVVAKVGAAPAKAKLQADPTLQQPAAKSLKLLARATGDFTRAELNKEGELRFTKAAKDVIDAVVAPAAPAGGNGEGGE